MQRATCSGTSAFDLSIIGDELEQHRIQLEHNLQETDLSLHLSSVPDDAIGDPSVEYPRHRGSPTPADLPSFSYASRSLVEPDSFSHPQAWSYGTLDEDGIHPFAGETISTAAHHASALTLSAGLAGREAASLSETEYDPERPLHRMIHRTREGPRTRSPKVINGKAKLDRVLQSGHAYRQQSSLVSTKSPQHTPESNLSGNLRPKLSDAFRHVSFSPKRLGSSPSRQRHTSQRAQLPEQPPTPLRRAKPSSLSSSRPASTKADAAVTKNRGIRPNHITFQSDVPPQDISDSHELKIIDGTSEVSMQDEIGSEHLEGRDSAQRKLNSPRPVIRNPFTDVVNQVRPHAIPHSSHGRSFPSRRPSTRGLKLGKGRVQLPDVTGLTSAIESPAKLALQHQQYRAHEFRESDACLISTLNAIQSKLSHLETENHISRRRVQELELELLSCSEKEADKDRTLPQKSLSELPKRSSTGSCSRGMGGADDESQALEDLVFTLRAHLTRLTAELSSHHRVLNELQYHHESDSRALKSKFRQVDILGQEVERLAGEVGVLRGMVEEGLRERQQVENDRSCSPVSSHDTGQLFVSKHEESAHADERSSHSRHPPRPTAPFPQIRGTRLEKLFFSIPEHCPATCNLCSEANVDMDEEDEGFAEGSSEGVNRNYGSRSPANINGKQPESGLSRSGVANDRTTKRRHRVLRNVVQELEDDFAHYKSIYVELAEEYKHMEAASDPPKRNILARHLREVIGLLEQRGDQIASLYDVLKSRNISAITDTCVGLQ